MQSPSRMRLCGIIGHGLSVCCFHHCSLPQIGKRGAHAPRRVRTTKRGNPSRPEIAGIWCGRSPPMRASHGPAIAARRVALTDGPKGPLTFAPGIVTRTGGDAETAAPGQRPRARSRASSPRGVLAYAEKYLFTVSMTPEKESRYSGLTISFLSSNRPARASRALAAGFVLTSSAGMASK